MMNNQIKSKHRVANHGEVFTHEREVNGMLDLVKNETERLDSIFLEPACGTGNFLVEVLNRKLSVLKQKYSRSQPEYEKYGVIVITSLYGVDLLEDNVEECRERLLQIFKKEYTSIFKHKFNNKYVRVLKFILSKNIICGDALTMKNNKGKPLIFSEWSMPYNDSKIKRKEYSFKDIITKLEPSLFKKVTGLKVEDFELLVSLGVFNSNLMNDAVFKFKRYEESSLHYTGIYKHKVEQVGGYDVIITAEEFNSNKKR